MVGCRSCEATLTAADRFCPACGAPNVGARFHPRFGPAPVEPPGAPTRPTEPPAGVPYCPRCWGMVKLASPFCGGCGMSLDETRAQAELARFGGVWMTPGPGESKPYRSIDRLTGLVRVLCGGVAVTALAVTIASAVAMAQSRAMFSSLRIDDDELASLAGRLQLVMICLMGLLALAFVRWTAVAYRNLEPLGVRGMRIDPRWATVVWLVPFGNFVWPKELIDDLYRGSDPSAPVLSGSWRLRTVPARFHLWWMAIIGGGVLLLAAQWVLPAPPNSGEVDYVGLSLAVGAHVLIVAGAILTGMLVQDVTDRQMERIERLGRAGRRAPRPTRQEAEVDTDAAPALIHVDSGSVWGRY
jgi:hypothetical protein